MSHWSADFETLGLRPDAKVLSLGLAKFDIKTGEILETYEWSFSAIGQEHRTKTPSTEEWWAQQSKEVQDAAFGGTVLLSNFKKEIIKLFDEGGKTILWGNGANFDVALLDNIFGYEAPWDFWNVRDMRTMVWSASKIGFDKESIPFEGDQHNALDDAIHQAKVISKAYRHTIGLYNAYQDIRAKYYELNDKVNP